MTPPRLDTRVSDVAIPDKFYFKIGEVAEIVGVEPHVVRFWESQFRLTPAKTVSKHRVYRRHEVEKLLEIRRLLYDEKFTIEGARRKIRELAKERKAQLSLDLAPDPAREALKVVKKELQAIRKKLEDR